MMIDLSTEKMIYDKFYNIMTPKLFSFLYN